ncbi:MAG: hypothetical protein ABI811_18835 [Acidobacteriota bacterium]
MKKFEFPLSRVTKWSIQKLSVEQLALLRLLQELADLDQRLLELREKATESQMKLQTLPVVTGYELQTLVRFMHSLVQERDRLQPSRKTLFAKIERQRQQVVAGHRSVRLLENLEVRRRSEWTLELSKEEDALASDLFLAKLARESREVTARSAEL